ncbi:hypothetical protein DPMN_093945 [Dreissena polymorpha]|uniref:Uncharacterized protein n=1 Tax=Dreissena polymorpha TaxID=45954 RepID=A0A9D4L558_DREPO|nr:hypothetical protein DPMN_093945 [Dreissena polymorpha]
MEGNEQKLTIKSNVLEEFFNMIEKQELLKDIDALGDFLLLNCPFLFVFDGHGNVSKMEHPEVL